MGVDMGVDMDGDVGKEIDAPVGLGCLEKEGHDGLGQPGKRSGRELRPEPIMQTFVQPVNLS
jgi:hypothetical protein